MTNDKRIGFRMLEAAAVIQPLRRLKMLTLFAKSKSLKPFFDIPVNFAIGKVLKPSIHACTRVI